MNSVIIEDSLFEAVLRQAVIESYEEELCSIPQDEEIAKMHRFSDTHIKKMDKLFQRAKRQEKIHVTTKWIKRSIAILLIITSVIFGALVTVPEVRAAVTGAVIEWFNQFTKFTSNNAEIGGLREWSPSYIPEGFTKIEHDNFAGMLTLGYQDQQGIMIDIICMYKGGSISVDNEHQEYYTVEEGDTAYHIFEALENGERNIIIWNREDCQFKAESLLPVNELFKVAQSIAETNL